MTEHQRLKGYTARGVDVTLTHVFLYMEIFTVCINLHKCFFKQCELIIWSYDASGPLVIYYTFILMAES